MFLMEDRIIVNKSNIIALYMLYTERKVQIYVFICCVFLYCHIHQFSFLFRWSSLVYNNTIYYTYCPNLIQHLTYMNREIIVLYPLFCTYITVRSCEFKLVGTWSVLLEVVNCKVKFKMKKNTHDITNIFKKIFN